MRYKKDKISLITLGNEVKTDGHISDKLSTGRDEGFSKRLIIPFNNVDFSGVVLNCREISSVLNEKIFSVHDVSGGTVNS